MARARQLPARGRLARHWVLDRGVVFLNHGSYGACPKPVLKEQQRLRNYLERDPVDFMRRKLEPLLDAARLRLARFIGARAADLVFVPNATAGVNTVLRSLKLRAGDEILITDHLYNACRNAAHFAASEAGAKVVVARIPYPLGSADAAVEAILARVTSKTRLALLDHVASPTALILPIEQLVAEFRGRNIEVLVDGAHAPGMLPLNLAKIGAAWYTGNCHKWLCAPKGAAFLYVREDQQKGLRPLAISHGANSPRTDKPRFQLEFGWTGTADPTAALCVPAAIEFLETLVPGGWRSLARRNREMALAARKIICDALEIPVPGPASMIAAMAAIPLPDGRADALNEALFQRHRIEVPINPWPDSNSRLLRISAQAYNALPQYKFLAEILKNEI